MSYDLYLFRSEPGVEPRQTLESLLSADDGLVLRKMLASKDPRAQREAAVSTRREATAAAASGQLWSWTERLLAANPGLVVTPSPDDPNRHAARRVVANQPKNGIEYTLSASHIAVSVPYSYNGPAANAVFAEISRGVAALAEFTGFSVYDPQLQRMVELPREVEALLTVYARGADTIAEKVAPARQGWWKGFFSRK